VQRRSDYYGLATIPGSGPTRDSERENRLMTRIATPTAVALSLVLALAGCAAGSATPESIPASASMEPTMSASNPPASASPSVDPLAFAVVSADFADGGDLPLSTTASAFSGQCAGDNLNPALEWSNLPPGTVSVAIAMTDASASNWVHWLHANIPVDVQGVATGASADLPGVTGKDQATFQPAYFGPCPPGPDHRYVFTVYALDTELGLAESYSYSDFVVAIKDHVLGQASITGWASGPA